MVRATPFPQFSYLPHRVVRDTKPGLALSTACLSIGWIRLFCGMHKRLLESSPTDEYDRYTS
jgi:ABC-type uncharacterized transport system permease subunit